MLGFAMLRFCRPCLMTVHPFMLLEAHRLWSSWINFVTYSVPLSINNDEI
jgi:hypothetical protein